MPYINKVWKNLPSNETPINAESLNAISEALAEIYEHYFPTMYENFEDIKTDLRYLNRQATLASGDLIPNAPWSKITDMNCSLGIKNETVHISGVLTGGNPSLAENAILFNMPEELRAFVIEPTFPVVTQNGGMYAKIDTNGDVRLITESAPTGSTAGFVAFNFSYLQYQHGSV